MRLCLFFICSLKRIFAGIDCFVWDLWRSSGFLAGLASNLNPQTDGVNNIFRNKKSRLKKRRTIPRVSLVAMVKIPVNGNMDIGGPSFIRSSAYARIYLYLLIAHSFRPKKFSAKHAGHLCYSSGEHRPELSPLADSFI